MAYFLLLILWLRCLILSGFEPHEIIFELNVFLGPLFVILRKPMKNPPDVLQSYARILPEMLIENISSRIKRSRAAIAITPFQRAYSSLFLRKC
jgi:hypothetical protein